MICVIYITDTANAIIQECKESLYRYCMSYKYNFVHLYSDDLHDYRDPKDRLGVIEKLHYKDDYVFVFYNYSIIVNQKIPLTVTTDTVFEKNPGVLVKLDTEYTMPILENFAFRNTSRAIDILREIAYFVYDPDRLMKYIRVYLFKEVSYTTYYSYFNKRATVGNCPASFDLGYNFNTLALTHIDQVAMLVSYYKNHQSVFDPILRLDGTTYIWGTSMKGCVGKVSFVNWQALKTSWGASGTYRWIHSNQYQVDLEDDIYTLTVLDDGNKFVGHSAKTFGCVSGVRFDG